MNILDFVGWPLLFFVLFGVLFFSRCERGARNNRFADLLFLVSNVLLILNTKVVSVYDCLFVFLIVCVVVLALKLKSRLPQLLLGFVFPLLVWLMLKYYFPLFHPKALAGLHLSLVGFSFVIFKLVRFFLDSREEGSSLKFENIVAWIFFFPTFFSGPIVGPIDYERVDESTKNDLPVGFKKILYGIWLKFGFSAFLSPYTLPNLSPKQLGEVPLFQIVGMSVAYFWHLYWDFAGYSAIAIGLALIVGFRVPENFNHPYLARNPVEFWNRWHMTLSAWIRDMIFYPLHIYFTRRSFNPSVSLFISGFITFIIAGIWHGPTYGFLCFGILHGLAFGATSSLKLREKERASSKGVIFNVVTISGTFAFVVFSFVFFCLDNQQVLALLRRIVRFFWQIVGK